MKNHYLIILIMLLPILGGCAESDVLTNYEELKDIAESKIPITFSAYVGDTSEESATTRADWNYLVYLKDQSTNYGRFDNIPFEGQQVNDHRRLGHLAYNNYIVGVYGFVHQNDWKDESVENLEADFMTNQPLLHLYKKEGNDNIIYWDYNPKKYWPNSNIKKTDSGYSTSQDKVTFISYYPYQGFSDDALYYRDGEGTRKTKWFDTGKNPNEFNIGGILYNSFKNETHSVDKDGFYYDQGDNWKEPVLDEKKLENIEPPKAKDGSGNLIKGEDAFTFTFQQKKNVKEHIDFMMGINPNLTKQSISDKVVLNLRHQLCAIRYKLNFYPNKYYDYAKNQGVYLEHVPEEVDITIKSIELAGMYDKGDIAPVWDNEGEKYVFQWTLYEDEPKATYTTFVQDPNQTQNNRLPLRYHETWSSKDTHANAKGHNINNLNNFYNLGADKGDGFKWLILALPQTANPETCVVVNYNMKYIYRKESDGITDLVGGPQTYYYEDCVDRIQLPNNTVFQAGKLMCITINFYFKGITMDAEVKEWPTDEELEVEGQIDG